MNTNQSLWNVLDVGDQLESLATITMPRVEGEVPVVVLTTGKRYKINYIDNEQKWLRIIDDSGIAHEIEGDYIKKFKHHPRVIKKDQCSAGASSENEN